MKDNDNRKDSDKKKTRVLVIVDMQNDFLMGSLGGAHCRGAVPGCVKLLQKEKWDRVYLTIDTHGEDYIETLEGRKLPTAHCIENTWGQKVCQEITNVVNQMKRLDEIPSNEELFVECKKRTFGAFDLAFSIERRVDNAGFSGDNLEIHMCGVCTSICVLANAVLLRAYYPNAEIIVHADACGDVSEEMHQHALKCLEAQLCEVVTDGGED